MPTARELQAQPRAATPVNRQAAPLSEAQMTEEINKAVDLAHRSDVAVLVLGESENMSGEYASRSALDLPGQQQQLLEAVISNRAALRALCAN